MTPDNQLRRTPATTETHCQVKCILIQCYLSLYLVERFLESKPLLINYRSAEWRPDRFQFGYESGSAAFVEPAPILSALQARDGLSEQWVVVSHL